MKIRLLGGFLVCGGLAVPSTVLAVGNSINLNFNGATTGFESSYNPDPSGFSLGGGKLTITTLPGDIFGNYENDPDSAKNVFFTHLNPLGRTIATTHVHIESLNVNFHGGGIWMGTDEDHYFRLGIINNTFEGGISCEGLRENEDRWGNANPPGPGDDIVNVQFPNVGTSPQTTPIDAILKIDRIGNTVRAFFSTDGGATTHQVGPTANGANLVYSGLATSPTDPQGNGSNTVEDTFKAGVYAFGGPDGSIPATFAFDDFVANSYLPGDANIDGKVDVTDLGALATNWQSTSGTWEKGDFNGDGLVNVTDLGALATNWQQSSLSLPDAMRQVGLSNVPEPAAVTLVMIAGAMTIDRRRRDRTR